MTEWTHGTTTPRRDPPFDTWEHWPEPEWRWHVAHSVPKAPRNELQEIVNERSPQEEHWTWSVMFQGSVPERWAGVDEWMVGGVCYSEAEAKRTCERVGPVIYELWASTRPRKH